MHGCGFQFVRYKRLFSTDFCSREHAVCPLSGIKKRPLVGGFLYISTIVISIGATAGVLYREVVRWWEGPLWEVPLYICNHKYTQLQLVKYVSIFDKRYVIYIA